MYINIIYDILETTFSVLKTIGNQDDTRLYSKLCQDRAPLYIHRRMVSTCSWVIPCDPWAAVASLLSQLQEETQDHKDFVQKAYSEAPVCSARLRSYDMRSKALGNVWSIGDWFEAFSICSFCLSLWLSLSLSVKISSAIRSNLYVYVYVYLSIDRSIYLSIDLSIHRSIYLSIDLWSIYLSIYLSIYPSTVSIYLSICLSINQRERYIYICMYIIDISYIEPSKKTGIL